VNVEKNTALKIENDCEEQISIQLKVKGDLSLNGISKITIPFAIYMNKALSLLR